ncbi:NAD(P)-dependent oxidoreductase [Fluviispira multicolorata]|nr:NAD(P)-dependent oxidoreductase [Fluviispira multicolorata]
MTSENHLLIALKNNQKISDFYNNEINKIAVFPQSFNKNNVLLNELIKETKIFNCSISYYNNADGNYNKFLELHKPNIIIVGLEKIDTEVLSKNPQLKFISKYGVGIDNLDIPLIYSKRIGIGWTPGVNKRSVAELVLSFALGHFRNVFNSIFKMKNSKWIKDGGKELSYSKVGIIGLGNIGLEVAKLFKGFNCDVSYYDIENKSIEQNKYELNKRSFNNILEISDIITFHVPFNEQTLNMLSKKDMSLIKSRPLIINTSRGDIIDFEDVTTAVKDGIISGYASDVFPKEPYDSKEFKDDYRFLFTPHIGGNSQEAVIAMGRESIKHIVKFLSESQNTL